MGGAGALVVSAAARALPEPVPMGSRLYLWLPTKLLKVTKTFAV